ncbi:CRISPR-associated helicase Cas3' [Deinococcus ruber]|uniref:CRISPR-associated endonuclease/helicase Cas3 n=1 Tax=Deinococcus ruber TaxID=1848197 RepID=A0A918C8R5_9DEIO|nr:CRISPR-associated helicase Cas3' [Deinococcus ruber]GGR11479.1 CRISPR-associated endonuclease/helicase Cas3 [Deinococcus ruber]
MTTLHQLLWAKSAKKETPDNWKPVLAHLLDVAACAWEVLLLEPESTRNQYAQDFGYPQTQEGRDTAMRWTCALIALHDLGKASPAFEQQWTEWPKKAEAATLGLDWNEGRTGPSHKPLGDVVSHSLISHATLPALLTTHGWNDNVARHLADAVGAHHGFRAKATELAKAEKPKEQGRGRWEEVRQELYDAVCTVLDVPVPPSIQTFSGGPYMRLAGLTSFADWIGSSFELEKFEHGHLEDPTAYFERARTLACEKLAQIDWQLRLPLSSTAQEFADVFKYMVPEDEHFQPRPLQTATQELLSEVAAPTLLLVEAPMGEGKTEIALYSHLTLQRQLGHRGLYIALPTQATGNAMFGRTTDFLNHVGGGRPLDLQLLHGGKELVRDFQNLRVHPNTQPEATDPQEELNGRSEAQRSVTAREWFTVRKRALLSEYGVGTVDQALLGVLPVAHQFIRLWGLGNRTVVLDEVHAYDMYTGHLIEELVKWLHALGSSVILMSATLPRARREALLRAYGADSAPWAEYPRLTRVSGGAVRAVTVQADASRNKTLQVRGLPESLHAVAARTLELHAQGGITAVIVNTVQRAQDLRRALADAGVPDDEVLLFHARARNKDRRSREERVLAQLGKNGNRPERLILLGSQVLEQSLDYDADVMLTDLAPVDLVLQRAGRLHRHARKEEVRAGHVKPVLHIAGLTPEAVPDMKGTAWQYIYQPWTLLRAWAILKDQPIIDLPAQLDELVQRAYQEADPDGLGADVQTRLAAALIRKTTQDSGGQAKATLSAIVSPETFPSGESKDPRWDADPISNDDEVGDEGERPVGGTRLGDESVTVVPLFRQGNSLYLDPDGMKAPLTSRDFGNAGLRQLNLVSAIHECSVRLSRYQVVKGIAAHAKANGLSKIHWSEVPALRDALPLVLDQQDGRWVTNVDGLLIRYDFELGVVYG